MEKLLDSAYDFGTTALPHDPPFNSIVFSHMPEHRTASDSYSIEAASRLAASLKDLKTKCHNMDEKTINAERDAFFASNKHVLAEADG